MAADGKQQDEGPRNHGTAERPLPASTDRDAPGGGTSDADERCDHNWPTRAADPDNPDPPEER
jgi:hypothetical protein